MAIRKKLSFSQAVVLRPQLLAMWVSFITACNMAVGFPLGEQSKRELRSHTVFSDLDSEVMDHHFCHVILVIQTNPDTIWERIAQRSLSLGVNLEAGLT